MIVDAGIGTASDATIAMELGCDGVLINSAIAHAKKPILMAKSFKDAVIAGRNSYLAGRMKKIILHLPALQCKELSKFLFFFLPKEFLIFSYLLFFLILFLFFFKFFLSFLSAVLLLIEILLSAITFLFSIFSRLSS